MKKSKQIVSLDEEKKNELKDVLAENLPTLRKILCLSQNDFGDRTDQTQYDRMWKIQNDVVAIYVLYVAPYF